METNNIGELIRMLRQEKNLTQKQLADLLCISDKAISKWERNQGLPDIGCIPELSNLLGIEAGKLLNGTNISNDFVNGNMKNTSYYVCPTCHNITLCTGHAEVSCCSKKLLPEELKKADKDEKLNVSVVEQDWYITSEHPMTKSHYISFIAFVKGDQIQIIKQYPEWNLNARIPIRGHGMIVWYCVQDGLFYQLV